MDKIDRMKLILDTNRVKQKELASYLKVTPQHINKILNYIENPSNTLLELFCEKFNLKSDWLIHGKGEMFKSVDINKFGIVVSLLKELDEKHQNLAIKILKDLVETENDSK